MRRLEVDPAVAVRRGRAAEEICRFTRENEADLLIMGQRGRRSAKPHLLGRTVRRALRDVAVPTMVVPGQERWQDADNRPDMPSYSRLLSAIDFSEASLMSLRATTGLSHALDAGVESVHVLRVAAMTPVVTDIEAWPLMVPREVQVDSERRLIHAVRSAVGEADSGRCKCSVVVGLSAAMSLVDAAANSGCGMIVVPTRARRRLRDVFFGTTTESILRLSEVPVVVMPLEYLAANYGQLEEEVAPALPSTPRGTTPAHPATRT
jgi:nucleotide-binding universal stress UspA family protein